MELALVLIICSSIFSIAFIIQSCFFLYKLILRRNTTETGVNTICVTPIEAKYCMGWGWKFAVDRSTNQMRLSLFILSYIINLFVDLIVTAVIFIVLYYNHN